ncbi:MAG: hypothetical protein IKJ65_05670 [Clostridia bacterium]|nr:hypothetical protein [Clostridia bacterium]
MKIRILAIALIVIIGAVVFGLNHEPELEVINSYIHRGTYSGNMNYNTYTFEIRNNSFFTDIDSLDYFNIVFYDDFGNAIGMWSADQSDLRQLSLSTRDTTVFQIDILESDLPYNSGWDYDYEYSLTYYS